jgi:hypothetical protein
MRQITRLRVGVMTLAAVIGCAQCNPATALATELHNVTYFARVDGVSRGAEIVYKIDDTKVNSANPTMIPGRTFEADAVLADPQQAGMQVSIKWPYSANLHCEIDVDDAVVAQADQFISPRLTPATDDPDYGTLSCGAPLSNGVSTSGGSTVNTGPADGSQPPADGPPPDGS